MLEAIDEFDRIGRDAFLERYGYQRSNSRFIKFNGKLYDQRPIIGVSYGKQHPEEGPLDRDRFKGAKKAGLARLVPLGFEIVELKNGKGVEAVGVDGLQQAPTSKTLWTRDELILVLDLYFKISVSASNERTPEVSALSKLLRTAPMNAAFLADHAFRNPEGVYTKLSKFLTHDPLGIGKGLPNPSELQKQVWSDFAGDRSRLERTARIIRTSFESNPKEDEYEFDQGGGVDEAAEGRIISRLHRLRERNLALVEKKKRMALAKGKLICEVCNFDFKAAYGDLGDGFIECHHKTPLSTLEPGRRQRWEI